MAPAPHLERVPIAYLTPALSFQESGFVSCQVGPCHGINKRMYRLSPSSSSLPSSFWNKKYSGISRYKDRHGFSSLLKHLSTRQLRKDYRTEVCVAADFPDAKSDVSSNLGDRGYHPLEDISSLERRKNTDHTDQRLTDAEIARTLTEVNEKAVIFPPMWDEENSIFGTEAQFVVDKHGDFYFQIDDDGEFLATLNDSGKQMNVATGYDSIEDWILEQEEVQNRTAEIDSDDDTSYSDEDEEDYEWNILTPEDTDLILGLDEESTGSVGDWSGLDTLQSIHPLDFADSLSSAALAENDLKIEKPSQSIRIIGEVNRLHGEEEKYVQQLFLDRFGDDNEEKNNNDHDADDANESQSLIQEITKGQSNDGHVIDDSTHRSLVDSTMHISISRNSVHSNLGEKSLLWPSEAGIGDSDDDIIMEFTMVSPIDGDSDVEESEEEESTHNESEVSFYKLDIRSIRVTSFFRTQLMVDKVEFRAAKPDILARTGPQIIERLNSRGKSLEDALKSVCLHRKGLKVEEVLLLQVDSLGMDIRVHCGREIRTIRISFGQQATSEEHAEKLVNELLFPRTPRKGRRKRKSRP